MKPTPINYKIPQGSLKWTKVPCGEKSHKENRRCPCGIPQGSFPCGKRNAPMNNVKIFQGRPRREAFWYWYTANTNLFRLTIFVTRKSDNQLGWVIKLVHHNLVWRIRFLTIKSFEKDFEYLYWTISKIIIWNLFTSKGTSWVTRAGWIERSWMFFSFLS